MENGRTFLMALLAVVCISLTADLFTVVEAKFSLSSMKKELYSGVHRISLSSVHSRSLGESDPCSKYGDGHSLPAGHPCASGFENVGVIPRLIGALKKGGSGGKHPPGVGKHPPGVGKHPPGVGKHPPRAGGDVRCRLNKTRCLDPAFNVFLATDPTATTCCKTKCVSLQFSSKNCKTCGKRCRKSKGDPGADCCSGSCVDLLTDSLNCGTCGTACGSSENCVGGVCVKYP